MFLNVLTGLVCIFLAISLWIGMVVVTKAILRALRACMYRIGDCFVRPEKKVEEPPSSGLLNYELDPANKAAREWWGVPTSQPIKYPTPDNIPLDIPRGANITDEEYKALQDAVTVAIAAKEI